MILTVTLNPAIDKTYELDAMLPHTVNRIVACRQYAGGKGINVTRILRQYNEEVVATGFLGGFTGAYIEREVTRSGARPCFTSIAGDTRINMNYLEKSGEVTEILEPGPFISEKEVASFIDNYKVLISNASVVVLSGSIPRGVPDDIYSILIAEAKMQNVKTILDTSGNALKNGIKAKPYMIKPNIHELAALCGQNELDEQGALEAAKRLVANGIENIVVSMGKDGFIHTLANETIKAVPPAVEVVNTVSCGDSIVAMYAHGIERQLDNRSIARLAAAVSAANATTKESGCIPIEVVGNIMESVEMKVF